MKVLVADDDVDVLESTRLLLEAYMHEVWCVPRAGDVRAAVATHRPDIVLLDGTLAGGDTAGFIAALRRPPAAPGMQVLLYTAHADAEDLWREVGADGLLRKPFDPQRAGGLFASS